MLAAACGDNDTGSQTLDGALGGDAGTTVGDGGRDGSALVAPTVTSTLPVNNAQGVAQNSAVSATFSKAMDMTTIDMTTFTLKQGATSLGGAVSYASATRTATLTPTLPLASGMVYTATITTGAHDSGSLALASSFTWIFTTAANNNPPTVTATTPLDLAINVSINARPTATFSKAMDPATLSGLTFTLSQGLSPIAGSVSLDGATNTATFTAASALTVGLTYTATVTTGAKDLGGAALASSHSWTFMTSACSQGPVALGAAASFAVLAGPTVTSTGLTSITGDLGVSPGSAITGFPPGIVVGMKHAMDPTAAAGKAALTIAYNDAAGRTLCAVSKSGNIGGTTLTPGLYKSTSGLAISSGDLTLDGQGDGNSVFIFQAASTLTTTSGRKILLTNNAKASNIFWQVGTSATIGTTSVFHGTIMANEAITLQTGASLDGRALARTAGITLDANTIVTPAP